MAKSTTAPPTSASSPKTPLPPESASAMPPLRNPPPQKSPAPASFPYPAIFPFPRCPNAHGHSDHHFDPQGGPKNLGFLRGTTRVNPDAWFFKAHFFEDPVWPGSLGLESFIQLLKVAAHHRWASGIGVPPISNPLRQTLANPITKNIPRIYRGQILPAPTKKSPSKPPSPKSTTPAASSAADGFLTRRRPRHLPDERFCDYNRLVSHLLFLTSICSHRFCHRVTETQRGLYRVKKEK